MTDEEVMYQVIAGELAGGEGELSIAADAYLEAAMLSSDPAVAERATRIAFAEKELAFRPHHFLRFAKQQLQ